ncbi:DUF7156 family protein [Nocardia nova]
MDPRLRSETIRLVAGCVAGIVLVFVVVYLYTVT